MVESAIDRRMSLRRIERRDWGGIREAVRSEGVNFVD